MADESKAQVLFLCSGNYYRSRFAEILFNSLAEERRLPWRADSRGLVVDRPNNNVGPISEDAVAALGERGVTATAYAAARAPRQLSVEDLRQASLIIAVKEAEHHPLMLERFPDWADQISYWHVHDLDKATADEALSELARHVEDLVNELTLHA